MKKWTVRIVVLLCLLTAGCAPEPQAESPETASTQTELDYHEPEGATGEGIDPSAGDSSMEVDGAESSSTASLDPSDVNSEDESQHTRILEGLVINKKYFHMGYDNVLKLHPQSQYDYRFNIIDDIIRIDWIAARGGYVFDGPHEEWQYTLNVDDSELPIIQRSNSIIADCGFDAPGGLADDTWMDDPMSVEDIWLRLIFKPYYPRPGTPYAPHKDWIIYIDPDNPDDAILAQQYPDNLNQWYLCQLPGYGAWLDIETDIFLRMHAL